MSKGEGRTRVPSNVPSSAILGDAPDLGVYWAALPPGCQLREWDNEPRTPGEETLAPGGYSGWRRTCRRRTSTTAP